MDSPRPMLPRDQLTAEIIGQRAAAQHIAIHAADCCGHFVWPWPNRGRPAFYWYAVEAVHSDHDDLPPALLVSEGFARTEARAQAAAFRALNEPRPPLHARLTRGRAPRHARSTVGASRALRLASVAVLLGVAVGVTAAPCLSASGLLRAWAVAP